MVRVKKNGQEICFKVYSSTKGELERRCKQCRKAFGPDNDWRRRATWGCKHVRCLTCVRRSGNCKQCDGDRWREERLRPRSSPPPPKAQEQVQVDVECPVIKEEAPPKSAILKKEDEQSESMELGPKPESKVLIPQNAMLVLKDVKMQKLVYRCQVCKKTFGTKYHCKYHQYCGLPYEEWPFQCKICKKGFAIKQHYDYHNNFGRVHANLERASKARAGKKVGTNIKWNKKVKPVQQTDGTNSIPPRRQEGTKRSNPRGQKLTCTKCKKVFSRQHNLTRHNAKICHLISPINPLMCSECPGRGPYKDARGLRRHLESHLRGFKKSFNCPDCSASFTRKDNVYQHQRLSCPNREL